MHVYGYKINEVKSNFEDNSVFDNFKNFIKHDDHFEKQMQTEFKPLGKIFQEAPYHVPKGYTFSKGNKNI